MLRISTRVPRDQRAPGPNSLGPVCPVPVTYGAYKYVSLWSPARIRVTGSPQDPSGEPGETYDSATTRGHKKTRVFQSICRTRRRNTRDSFTHGGREKDKNITKKTMSRPPGRAAAGLLLISWVTLVTAH